MFLKIPHSHWSLNYSLYVGRLPLKLSFRSNSMKIMNFRQLKECTLLSQKGRSLLPLKFSSHNMWVRDIRFVAFVHFGFEPFNLRRKVAHWPLLYNIHV